MEQFPVRILIATDGSENATLAVRAAADICKNAGSQPYLVHAWQAVPSTRFGPFVREQLRQDADRLLDEQATEVEVEDATGMPFEIHLREGRAAEEIVGLAAEIDAGLIVIGSRGLGPAGRLFPGSVSDEVVRRAPCPVLVMGAGEDSWPPRRVVFADDCSEEARKAGKLAATIGELYGASGTLLRSYPVQPKTDEEARDLDPRAADDGMRREQDCLSTRASELEESLDNPVGIRLVEDDAATAVLEAAEEDQENGTLVAVGSRGLGILERTLRGSVSTEAKTKASGPVLVHPPLERADGQER